ncbi:MAG: hypothetical protein FD175_956 [Beijerinckiaceae bacterium]|nr:MAG: hypothetical protein FD175_956 [Beijerinckiaceae bacterium]
MNVRVATFNLENLFNRYAFLDGPWGGKGYENFLMAVGVASVASRKGDLVAESTTTIQRNNTALAIESIDADIIAVQEIENIYALRNFNSDYLSNMYETVFSIDGNDPRAIDVGIMIKRSADIRITGFRTHIDDPVNPKKPVIRDSRAGFGYFTENAVFSRDCLEIDLAVGKAEITLLVNHFKAQDRNKSSIERRKAQADRVSELVDDLRKIKRKPIVLGDLNIDTKQKSYDKSLDALTAGPLLDGMADSKDLWTHFYDSENTVSRLDYILTDPALDVVKTGIFREGLSTKCKQYTGKRFATIGPNHTEASDHCPSFVEIKL